MKRPLTVLALCLCGMHGPSATAAAPVEAPMSLNFQNVEVRQLLQVFADFTGLNMVVSDSVKGSLSVRLVDLPWPQALEAVLRSRGLVSHQDAQVLWIGPQDEWLQIEKKRLEHRLALETLAGVQTFSQRLQYARATDLAQRLQAAGGRWLSERGSVLAEPRTNQIFVADLPNRLVEIRAMLERLDVPVRQVSIEARIVEADDQFGDSLGVRLGAGLRMPLRGGAPLLTLGAGNAGAAAGTLPGNQVNLPAGNAGQTVQSAPALAVSLFNAAADRFINLEISALEAEGRGKVVSRPRVITADQTKALIEQGTELPYQSASASGATSISFRKANLKLEVTPQITPEGAVVLDVDVTRDSVGQLTPAGYAINTKHVKTQVQVVDGGTVVLGGIFEDTDKQDQARVPALGEVPVIGWLFRNRQQVQRRSELLVFLTPRVLAEGPATLPADAASTEPVARP
jgi:type IV pilus assembly protein PilQ